MRRLLLFMVLSTAAHAGVLWRGDFETGDLSQWSELEGQPARISAVQSPVAQGAYAGRFELRQGDYANGGCRNELDHGALESEGNERWYAWSTMFDASYPSAKSWQVFTQWHHTGSSGSPPVEFDVEGEQILLTTTGSTTRWSAPLVRGAWHRFVLHVIWSADANTGLLELWYDGVRVLEPLHTSTLYPGQQVYLKQGLYRDASIQPTAVVFHDAMTVGTTQADVMAPPAAPPPAPDAGTPPADAGAAAAPDPVSPDGGAPAAPDGLAAVPPQGCSSAGAGLPALLALGALLIARRARRRSPAHGGRPSA